MKTLALTGWGQPHNALAELLPEADHLEYAQHASIKQALAGIADTARGYDRIVGWSLGGQLAVRAIAQGLVAPKKLVLIAAPFQFVELNKNGIGMKRDTFDKFFGNYAHNPLRTLHKAWDLVHFHDERAAHIKETLSHFSKQAVLAQDWLNWLRLIDGFSCESLDFSRFPSTLIVHGQQDAVVDAAQSRLFADRIKDARLELWPECGHAPHWHDAAKLRRLIEEHTHV